MKCESCKKIKLRTQEEKKKLITRLNRVEGQVRGVKQMINDDRYCNDIIIQLAAINKAIKSIANVMIEEHMHTCMIKDIKEGNEEVINEIIELFKRFQ